ncbi:hypothetical protein [Embleya sp. NPDC005575]|uniref:hypothetical protein n=1 Tax=Embleya sp. NPDC005575 TaxID=3156892 RepID=UPI0033B00BB0
MVGSEVDRPGAPPMISGGATTPALHRGHVSQAPAGIRPGGRISPTGCAAGVPLAGDACGATAASPAAAVLPVVRRPMIGASTSGAVARRAGPSDMRGRRIGQWEWMQIRGVPPASYFVIRNQHSVQRNQTVGTGVIDGQEPQASSAEPAKSRAFLHVRRLGGQASPMSIEINLNLFGQTVPVTIRLRLKDPCGIKIF